MNNTEKLLRAFIEASGFEVEEALVNSRPLLCNDKPTGKMAYDYIDYKVTKKIEVYNAQADEFIKGHGYCAGDFVSSNGRYYRSLIGGDRTLNYKPLNDMIAWVEYVSEKTA